MRIFILITATIISLSSTEIVDAIAIDVNGEPITTLDIETIEKKFNISKKMAIEILIQDRLEKSAIERANIEVSQEEVDEKIAQISSSKGISLDKLKFAISKSGISFEDYKQEIKKGLQKEKFLFKKVMPLIPKPTDEELKLFFNTNRDKFENNSPMSQISVLSYFSNSSSKIKQAISNPMMMIDGVVRKNQLITAKDVPANIFQIIQNTPEGSFTKPINTGRGFISYYVKSKAIQNLNSNFEMVKNQVELLWLQEQRKKAMKDFIDKLKDSAEIRIIRI